MAQRTRIGLSLTVIAGWGLGLGAGCKDQEPESRVRELSGVIVKIDAKNKEVTVRYYNEKKKMEMIHPVKVTDETEILINGALADITAVKEGERAKGSIRVSQTDQGFELTALRVEIKRAQPLKPTTDEAAPPDTGNGS